MTTYASPAPATRPAPPPEAFLVDWKTDHRGLLSAHRAADGAYVFAIVARQCPESEEAALRRLCLWARLRSLYDALRGPWQKSDAEDFTKAMSQL